LGNIIRPNWFENLVLVATFMILITALFIVIEWVRRKLKDKYNSKPSVRDRLVQHGIYPTIKDDEIGKEIKKDGDNS
jgi:hypothetical protein